ncbi:cupin domain-containing protein [Chloroflexota bacterium]
MRRVVTGLTQSGKSIFVLDGEPPRNIKPVGLDSQIFEIWATDCIPTIPVEDSDPTVEMSSFIPGPGGTRFRIWRMPGTKEVERATKAGVDIEAVRQERLAKMPPFAAMMEKENVGATPGMHTTDTIDYGIVISGEIWMELDDGAEVHLKQGDCVIQNGTKHAWLTRSPEPCVMAWILIGAERK